MKPLELEVADFLDLVHYYILIRTKGKDREETRKLHEQSLSQLIGSVDRVEVELPSGRMMAKPAWFRDTTEEDVMLAAHKLRQG